MYPKLQAHLIRLMSAKTRGTTVEDNHLPVVSILRVAIKSPKTILSKMIPLLYITLHSKMQLIPMLEMANSCKIAIILRIVLSPLEISV